MARWQSAPIVQDAGLEVPRWKSAPTVEEKPTREQTMRRQADERLARERAENPDLDALSAPGAAETAIRGIPILGGFVDEAKAGVSAGANWLTGGRVGEPYEEALEYERAKHRRSDAENPVANTVTKLAGGVAMAPLTPVLNATTRLGRIGAGGISGAAYGAGHGFAEGEGGFDERLKTAGDYAKFGGALGVGLPLAAQVAGGTYNAVRTAAPQIAARLPGRSADNIADDLLRQRMERGGTTPQAVQAELQAGQDAARFGPNSQAHLPEMIADTSDAMQRLTGSVYRQGGEAGETVRRALETRQRGDPNQVSRFASGDTGQRGQIDDALSRALRISSSKSARATERQITAEQAREGKRLYEQAYNNSEDFDLGDAIVALGLVRQQYTGPFRAALDRASALFEAPAMGRVTGANRNYYGMDIRRFDAAKKQLDDMIESAQRSGENNLARELTQFKNNLLDKVHAVDEAGNPTRNLAYRDARNAWGSAAENREAIEMGRAALREGSEVSVEQFRSLTPGQQVLFRQGFLESARNALGRRRPGNDATLPFQEARVQDLLREIVPNTRSTSGAFADRSGKLGEYISRQERMGATRNRVLGNSATTQRQQDDAEFAADALSRVMMGLRGGTNAILEVVGAALTRATSYRQDVALALARRLVEADPAAQARILQNLQRQIGPNRFQEFARSLDSAIPSLPGIVGDEDGGQAPQQREQRFQPPMRLGGPKPADQGAAPTGGNAAFAPKAPTMQDFDPQQVPVWERQPEMFQGEVRNQNRPQDYTAPISEMVAPFVPVPGVGIASKAIGAAASAPRATGAAAGLAGYVGMTGEGGANEDIERIKTLQTALKNAGYYKGPIDGIMGGGTQEANNRYQADLLAQEQLKAQQQQAETARTEAEAKRAEAEANKAAAETRRREIEKAAAERAEGAERLRKLQEDTPAWQKFLHDYGPYMGYAVGLFAGHRGRHAMTSKFNRSSAEAAEKANAYVSGGRRSFEDRVGGVNRFWQEGGAKEVPFRASPTGAKGVTPNKAAPPAAELYQPPKNISEYIRIRDGLVAVGAGSEVFVTTHMRDQAKAELVEARKLVAADPSEANIQHMKKAETEAAMWDTLARVGIGAGLGYFGSAPASRYKATRPDVGAAEAERLRLQKLRKK